MFAKWELNHLSSIDHDCTVCQRERDLPLNPRLCDSCKGWDDLIHVMDCLEPEYPKINPNCFGLKFGADRDPIFHQSTSIEDYDQDLGSLNYRPLDQHSFSTACMLCCRIDEEIRISISSQSRIEVGVWRPFPVPRKGHQIFRWWEFARVDKLENMDEKSVRLILPVSVKSKATRTPEKLFKTLVIGFELHYAHLGYKLEAITRWNHSLLDPGIVKEFIGNCREHHRSQCNEPRWPAKVPQFFRVIDTKNWCVQLAPEEHFEYLALSYVWGAPTQSQRDINILQLDTTTLPELEQKNSLRKYSIPEVIQDAINLCADLGYQYLWVDRFCIVQDDGSHKHSQIDAMGSIYHMATLTIVSLGGCSSGGLPGASSRPRDTKEQFKRWRLSIDGRYSHALPPSIHDEVSTSKWDQRGWTYQERILSRRHLFVSENDFYLSCSNAIFESDSGWKIDYRPTPPWTNVHCYGYEKGIRSVEGADDPTNSPMRIYMDAVTRYTARTLTFDQDALNAFAGVGNLFAYQQHTNLLFGLPEKFFFQSILWHHAGTSRSRNLGADISIPSWSWAAWEGSVSYETKEWRRKNHKNSFDVHTKNLGSLVTFYYVDPLRGLRQIQDGKSWFYVDILSFSDDSHELQDQCEYMIRLRLELRRELDTMDKYTTIKMWRNSVQNPWKAIKHAEIRDEDGSLQRKFPGTLAFNTTVAALEVRDYPTAVMNNDPEASGNVLADLTRTDFNLVAGDNTVVGQVFVNCREIDLRTLRSGKNYRVAVIGACLSNGPLNNEPWGLIVIILGEHGGIYRRLALGVVNLEAWTKLRPQWETVLLG